MSKEQVLALLREAEGDFISGEKMSRLLGVSRAAVWKDIDLLRQEGYEVESVTRRGYRLLSAPDLLTKGNLLPLLEGVPEEKLVCLPTIDSTNTYAKKLAMEGGADGTAVVANHQTGGKGRMGRSFQSPENMGTYITLLYRPPVQPMRAVELTSVAATAVCEGIERACGIRPGIKWTNDIIMDGKKVCGILTEMSVEGESGTLQYVVVGIGINVLQQPEDFPEELRSIAGSVSMAAGRPVSRCDVTAGVINALNRAYRNWLAGSDDYKTRYRADCLTLGRQVDVIRGGRARRGFAEGLDEELGLIVRYEDGTRETVFVGDVSVRGIAGYV